MICALESSFDSNQILERSCQYNSTNWLLTTRSTPSPAPSVETENITTEGMLKAQVREERYVGGCEKLAISTFYGLSVENVHRNRTGTHLIN